VSSCATAAQIWLRFILGVEHMRLGQSQSARLAVRSSGQAAEGHVPSVRMRVRIERAVRPAGAYAGTSSRTGWSAGPCSKPITKHISSAAVKRCRVCTEVLCCPLSSRETRGVASCSGSIVPGRSRSSAPRGVYSRPEVVPALARDPLVWLLNLAAVLPEHVQQDEEIA